MNVQYPIPESMVAVFTNYIANLPTFIENYQQIKTKPLFANNK